MIPSPTQRWRIVVSYHGGAFVGWQVQPDGRTVQGTLEAACAALLGHPTHVAGSGRTDAGVHALAQVAAFDADVPRTARSIRDGLNAHLPDDVAVVSAEPVAADFDPRRHARRKLYRYSWLVRPSRCPLRGDRTLHVRTALDVDAMDRAARHLVGRHDFSAFRAVGCAAHHPVRTLEDAVVRADGDLVHLEVVGNGFLRHMVRIIAGTLHEVGDGRRDADDIVRLLASGDRSQAGRTAQAHGLTLVWVRYPDADTHAAATLDADAPDDG
ncbi:MAG: tRNA pseudouridine(38-40) synthase TruA [Alphaproteobacteria bacterium]|nr:tRNA pseudouridine(38-40) synthase TruA [Alphaproteobacteria bacterium]